MSKSNSKDERKPDLSIPDQDVLEEKVKAMLDIEDKVEETSNDEKKEKVIKIDHIDEEPILSAPELPTDNALSSEKSKKINVIEHTEETEDKEIDEQEENQEDKNNKEEPAKENDEPDKPKEEPLAEADDDQTESQEPANSQTINHKPDITPVTKESKVESVIQDEKTTKAVEDIVAKESDELLSYEDNNKNTPADSPRKPILARLFTKLFGTTKKKIIAVSTVFILLIVVFAVPTSRYKILNTIGVRASVVASVTDASTGQPLKNVSIKVGTVEAKTDSQGQATLNGIILGSQEMIVNKRAFAEEKQFITVGLGDNQAPAVSLDPTGVQYAFVVTDFISKNPIHKAEVSFGEASAISDENGKIRLTIEDSQDIEKLDLDFTKDGYRKEDIEIDAEDRVEKDISMVSSRKHIFVTKRDGNYDVYSIYVDGKYEEKILTGTGNERDDIDLKLKPNESIAAYVSTKSGEENQDKFKLSTLSIINSENSQVDDIDKSERIQLIGWIDDSLVYVKATAGSSASKPDRHKLIAYNYKTKESKEIASSNYFNDVIIADNKIYYAPSGALSPQQAKLYRVAVDGDQKTEIAQIEVYKIFRADYENLQISANQNWLNLRIGEDKVTAATSPPSNPRSRIYSDSLDGKNSLWVDNRDGKGVLINYEEDSRNELTLKSENGLADPVYWLNDRTVVYRVYNENESADYILSLDGGEAKKIADVTNANAVDDWYYY